MYACCRLLLVAAAESSVTASTLHDGTALKEALVWRILQRIRLTDMNLNINKALLKVFDYMDKGNNKELTMQEFCDGINSEVLNMSWTEQQTRQLFKVLWVLRELASACDGHFLYVMIHHQFLLLCTPKDQARLHVGYSGDGD